MGEPTGLSKSLDDLIADQRAVTKGHHRKGGRGKIKNKDRRYGRGGVEKRRGRDFQSRQRRYSPDRRDRGGRRGRFGRERRPVTARIQEPFGEEHRQEESGEGLVLLAGTLHGKLNVGLNKQTCEMDDQGNVVIKYDGVDMIKINAKGDVILDTHGRHERAVAKSLSYTLMPIGIKFSTSNMQSYDESDWNVSDGYSLMRFYDGIELKGKGYAHYNRGKLVADAFIALRKTRVPGFQGSMEALGQGEEEHVEDDVQEMHM